MPPQKRVHNEQQDLSKYKKRLDEAERKLIEKHTKTAEKEKGVCERQIERIKDRIERIQSKTLTESDSRFYSKNFAPIIIGDKDGERVIQLHRYLMRPDGQPESFDTKYPVATMPELISRRLSVEVHVRKAAWSSHRSEVLRERVETRLREEEAQEGRGARKHDPCFEPRGIEYIIIPCLYDIWHDEEGNEVLHSFALITDDPNPEVAEAGHNRTPIFLKESAIDSWLFPEGKSKEELYSILREQREQPYYEHRIAA